MSEGTCFMSVGSFSDILLLSSINFVALVGTLINHTDQLKERLKTNDQFLRNYDGEKNDLAQSIGEG